MDRLIFKAMRYKGLSKTTLAARMGMTLEEFNYEFEGDVRLSTLRKVLDVLNYDVTLESIIRVESCEDDGVIIED